MRIPKRALLVAAIAAITARKSFSTPYDLTGKVALISGGSRGLGLSLARELVQRGAKVALLARDSAELQRAVQDIQRRGGEAFAVSADLNSKPDLERAVAQTAQHFGRLDVVVNNAGTIQTGPLENMTEANFHEIMEVNAFGALRLTKAALPELKKVRGRVLIISSVAGKAAIPHLAPYSVSKFASYGLGQALRAELAQFGVGVTTVLPGLMRTGSAKQAEVKGQYELEYTGFATLDNSPVVSLNAAEAARRIVNALVLGKAEAMIGGPAELLRWASALAPELTADVMALSNRFLPKATDNDAGKFGREVETPLTRHNALKQRAEDDLNQL